MFMLRLLIVEKSKGLQVFVRELFESFGFSPDLIQSVGSPQAALEAAADLKPDFLLTDWFSGEPLTGIGLHKELLAFNPACQFALLSAEVGPQHMEQARQAGALFLQGKPCSAVELRTALGRALQQLPAANPQVDRHVNAIASAAARHLSALTVAAKLPNFVPGQKVIYKGRRESVRNVILRRGELALQLDGTVGLVPSSAVSKV